MKKPYLKLGLNFAFIALITAGLIVGNNVLHTFEGEINTALAAPIVDDEAVSVSSKTGQEMSSKILQEGAVLLKNDNKTLPLDRNTTKKVNVFGWRSIDWIYGSEGQNASGGVAPENDKFEENVDIYKALNKYGVSYNTKLFDMYHNFEKPKHLSANLRSAHISTVTPLREPSIEDKKYYSDDLLNYTKDFSDTAIVVIGRMAGEAMNCDSSSQVKGGPGATNDTSRHYLEISTEEEALLKYCGANFEKTIVLINASNPFECGFLETIEGIDACMYIGFTGTRAANVLPKLLYGEYSPSGHTVDTFAYDLFTNPANLWDGGYSFLDQERSYTDYIENIYVGYKWYETADKMGIWNDVDNEFGKGYEGIVQFPFGYGLSYTNFSWEVGDILINENPYVPGSKILETDKIYIPVTVTNTGEHKGQDVVELYVETPYTPGGIEKASTSLTAFAKTSVLEPGKSETVTIEVDPYDFASYDCYDLDKNDFKGWELEKGDYIFSLQTDSHVTKNVTYKGSETEGKFTFNVDETINIANDPVTGKPVKNLFTGEDAVDIVPIDANDGTEGVSIPWIKRNEMKKPSEYDALPRQRKGNEITKNFTPQYNTTKASEWEKATIDPFGEPIKKDPVIWGKAGELKVADDKGIVNELGLKLASDYNAPEWEEVLDQVTVNEAIGLINRYYGTKAIPSIGKPAHADFDGPAQIKGFTGAPRGTGYPTMVVIAQTWNQKLAYEFGKAYGDDMKSLSVQGVWGWAIDNHRTAWFGRNHESPSEDSVLAGMMITNAVKGLNTRGRYGFLKHFALYGAKGDCQFVTEQALRENYLKSFRMAFVEGGALGCMTTYQGVGAEHSETTVALLDGVLRREWDFKGAITTDYIGDNSLCEAIIRCGGNLGMGVGLGTIGITYNDSYLNANPRMANRIRESVHQTVYMWLKAVKNEQDYLANPDKNETTVVTTSINGWQWWKDLVLMINVCAGILLSMWGLLVILSVIKPKTSINQNEVTGKDE